MQPATEVLARIVAPHFVAGIVIRDGVVIDAAPIVRYVLGWPPRRVLDYCTRKGWTVARVPKRIADENLGGGP